MLGQRSKVSLDRQIFFEGPRNSFPFQEQSSLEQLRTFSQWLLMVPVVMFLLFGCGQLALIIHANIQFQISESSLSAQYGPWEYLSVGRVGSDIIEQIRIDLADDVDVGETFEQPISEPGQDWIEETVSPVVVVALPTLMLATPTPEPPPTQLAEGGVIPTSTIQPTALSPQQTLTPLPTTPPLPIPETGSQSERFPEDDAWIRLSQPGNDGSGNHLKLQFPNKIIYLKFSLAGLTCTGSPVALSMITTHEKPGTVHLHRAANAEWDEGTIEGTNSPAIGDRIGTAVASGAQWETLSWEVTAVVCGAIQNGKSFINFALLMTEGEQVYFSSKENQEGRFSPRLVFAAAS